MSHTRWSLGARCGRCCFPLKLQLFVVCSAHPYTHRDLARTAAVWGSGIGTIEELKRKAVRMVSADRSICESPATFHAIRISNGSRYYMLYGSKKHVYVTVCARLSFRHFHSKHCRVALRREVVTRTQMCSTTPTSHQVHRPCVGRHTNAHQAHERQPLLNSSYGGINHCSHFAVCSHSSSPPRSAEPPTAPRRTYI